MRQSLNDRNEGGGGRLASWRMLGSFLAAASLTAGAAQPVSAGTGGAVCTCSGIGTPVRHARSAQPIRLSGVSAVRAPVAAKVYVADEVSGTVSVIDVATNEKIASINVNVRYPDVIVPFAPRSVYAAPDGRTVWVSAPQPLSGCSAEEMEGCGFEPLPAEYAIDEVVVIDPTVDSIVARIQVKPLVKGDMVHLAHIVVDDESRFAYVAATQASQIVRIDVNTFEIVGRVDLGFGKEPDGMRLCGENLVVANGFGGRSMSIVSTKTGKVEEIPLDGVAQQTACTTDNGYAFVSLYDTREVVRFNFETGALDRIALPESAKGPVQIHVTPDDKLLYVCDQGTLFGRMPSDKLFEIDIEKAAVSGEFDVGWGPNGIEISDDGSTAYITNLLDASVTVFDLAKRRIIEQGVKVGTAPKGISYWRGADLTQ